MSRLQRLASTSSTPTSIQQFLFLPLPVLGQILTADSNGDVAVDELVNGDENCWIAPGAVDQQTQAHLVITDFTMVNDGAAAYRFLLSLVPETTDVGRLFVWQEGNILEIKSIDDLEKIDYRKITPTLKDNVAKKLSEKYRLNKHQFRAINWSWRYKLEQSVLKTIQNIPFEEFVRAPFSMAEKLSTLSEVDNVLVNFPEWPQHREYIEALKPYPQLQFLQLDLEQDEADNQALKDICSAHAASFYALRCYAKGLALLHELFKHNLRFISLNAIETNDLAVLEIVLAHTRKEISLALNLTKSNNLLVSPKKLAKLRLDSITALNLEITNQLKPAVLSILEKCSNLRSLTINHNLMLDSAQLQEMFTKLASLTQLEELSISLNNVDIAELLHAMPIPLQQRLKIFKLIVNNQPQVLNILISECQFASLETLSIYNYQVRNQPAIIKVINSAKQLRNFELIGQGMTAVDDLLTTLTTAASETLTTFNLANCVVTKNEMFCNLLNKCSYLQHVKVLGVTAEYEEDFKLSKLHSNLESLHLENVAEDILFQFAQTFPRLKKLSVIISSQDFKMMMLEHSCESFMNRINAPALEELIIYSEGIVETSLYWQYLFHGKDLIRKLHTNFYTGMKAIEAAASSLTELTIFWGFRQNIDHFIRLLTQAKNIKVLNILSPRKYMHPPTDEEFNQLISLFQGIKVITLPEDYSFIKPDHLIALSRLPHLEPTVKRSLEKCAVTKPQQHLKKITAETSQLAAAQRTEPGHTPQIQQLIETKLIVPENIPQYFMALNVAEGNDKSSPENYRLKIYDVIRIEEEKVNFDETISVSDLQEYKIKVIKPSTEMAGDYANKQRLPLNSYGGCKEFIFKSQETLPLPSLDCNELLHAIYLSPENIAKIKVYYSKKQRRYFLQNLTKQVLSIKVDFRLQLLPTRQTPEDMNETIEALIKEYQNITEEVQDYSAANDIATLEKISKSHIGTSQQLAQACFWEFNNLKEDNPELANVEMRLVSNNSATFIEYRVAENRSWLRREVGAYRPLLDAKKIKIIEPVLLTVRPETSIIPAAQKTQIRQRIRAHFEQIIIAQEKLKTSAYKDKNILLHCQQKDSKSLLAILQRLVIADGAVIFYADSPSDLADMQRVFKLEDESSCQLSLVAPPKGGSALFEFLQANRDKAVNIVINWGNFTKNDFTKYLHFLNIPRTHHLFSAIANLTIYSIYPNDKDDLYREVDFINSHQEQLQLSLKREENILSLKMLPSNANLHAETTSIVNLHHSAQWYSRLVGNKTFDATGFAFVAGPLLEAIKAGKSVVLRNAPLNDLKFEWFCAELLRTRELNYFGRKIALPPNFAIMQQAMDDAEYYAKVLADCEAQPPEHSLCVNQSTWPRLFVDYHTDAISKVFSKIPGLLAKSSVNPIPLLVTHNLSLDMWDELFAWADQNNVRYQLYLAPNVSLPVEFGKTLQAQTRVLSKLKSPGCEIYFKDNIDYSLQALSQRWPQAKLICASELTAANCLYQAKPRLHEDRLINDKEIISEIWQDLLAGKEVVLYGELSSTLCASLAPLILQNRISHNGVFETNRGRLILVTENNMHFDYVETQAINLTTYKPTLPHYIEDTWASEALNETICQQALTARQALFAIAIVENKLLLVEGKTAVGKSTILNNELPKYFKVFKEKQFLAWLLAKPENDNDLQILVIDEANLKATNWQLLQDLLKQPPSIFYQGKYYPLSAQHRVVFAGNNKNYQAGRRELKIVERQAAKLTLNQLPPAVLYQQQIKSMKPQQITAEAWEQLWQQIYYFYKHYPEIYTPRELEAIAHLLIYQIQAAPQTPIQEYAAYLISKFSNPKIETKLLTDISKVFAIAIDIFGKYRRYLTQEEQEYYAKQDLIYLPSRAHCYEALYDVLAMRNVKLAQTQDVPGLSGIVFSGLYDFEAKLTKVFLESQGLHLYQHGQEITAKTYFEIAPKLDFEQKRQLLILAEANKAVVLMDQINTPLTEHLLNELTGGQGKKQHGMTIIGLMSDNSFDGRDNSSEAFHHRFQKIAVSPFSIFELQHLLSARLPEIPEELRNLLINEFVLIQHEMISKSQTALSITDLFTFAKEIMVMVPQLQHLPVYGMDDSTATTPTTHFASLYSVADAYKKLDECEEFFQLYFISLFHDSKDVNVNLNRLIAEIENLLLACKEQFRKIPKKINNQANPQWVQSKLLIGELAMSLYKLRKMNPDGNLSEIHFAFLEAVYQENAEALNFYLENRARPEQQLLPAVKNFQALAIAAAKFYQDYIVFLPRSEHKLARVYAIYVVLTLEIEAHCNQSATRLISVESGRQYLLDLAEIKLDLLITLIKNFNSFKDLISFYQQIGIENIIEFIQDQIKSLGSNKQQALSYYHLAGRLFDLICKSEQSSADISTQQTIFEIYQKINLAELGAVEKNTQQINSAVLECRMINIKFEQADEKTIIAVSREAEHILPRLAAMFLDAEFLPGMELLLTEFVKLLNYLPQDIKIDSDYDLLKACYPIVKKISAKPIEFNNIACLLERFWSVEKLNASVKFLGSNALIDSLFMMSLGCMLPEMKAAIDNSSALEIVYYGLFKRMLALPQSDAEAIRACEFLLVITKKLQSLLLLELAQEYQKLPVVQAQQSLIDNLQQLRTQFQNLRLQPTMVKPQLPNLPETYRQIALMFVTHKQNLAASGNITFDIAPLDKLKKSHVSLPASAVFDLIAELSYKRKYHQAMTTEIANNTVLATAMSNLLDRLRDMTFEYSIKELVLLLKNLSIFQVHPDDLCFARAIHACFRTIFIKQASHLDTLTFTDLQELFATFHRIALDEDARCFYSYLTINFLKTAVMSESCDPKNLCRMLYHSQFLLITKPNEYYLTDLVALLKLLTKKLGTVVTLDDIASQQLRQTIRTLQLVDATYFSLEIQQLRVLTKTSTSIYKDDLDNVEIVCTVPIANPFSELDDLEALKKFADEPRDFQVVSNPLQNEIGNFIQKNYSFTAVVSEAVADDLYPIDWTLMQGPSTKPIPVCRLQVDGEIHKRDGLTQNFASYQPTMRTELNTFHLDNKTIPLIRIHHLEWRQAVTDGDKIKLINQKLTEKAVVFQLKPAIAQQLTLGFAGRDSVVVTERKMGDSPLLPAHSSKAAP
jgi:hypothetical protein